MNRVVRIFKTIELVIALLTLLAIAASVARADEVAVDSSCISERQAWDAIYARQVVGRFKARAELLAQARRALLSVGAALTQPHLLEKTIAAHHTEELTLTLEGATGDSPRVLVSSERLDSPESAYLSIKLEFPLSELAGLTAENLTPELLERHLVKTYPEWAKIPEQPARDSYIVSVLPKSCLLN